MAETTVDFDTRWKGYKVTFRDLPASRCDQCGYLLFTPATADIMTDFIDARLARKETVPEVLTVEEAAQYLRVSPQTVYSLARNAELPGSKIGGQLRFLRSALEGLLKPQNEIPLAAAAFRGKPAPEDLESLGQLIREERQKDEPKR
jgi:excisionase family DNA binding protein